VTPAESLVLYFEPRCTSAEREGAADDQQITLLDCKAAFTLRAYTRVYLRSVSAA